MFWVFGTIQTAVDHEQMMESHRNVATAILASSDAVYVVMDLQGTSPVSP
jgi:hypothetical protein